MSGSQKDSHRPKANLTVAERRVLRALKGNKALTVLSAHKGNATVVLDTADYNWKKGPTESMEHKTMLLQKKSSVSEDVCQQLQPQGSSPQRLHGLLKIHKQGASLGPTVSTIGAPTYLWTKHLLGILGSHTGNSPCHTKNSTDFVCTLGSLCARPWDIIVSFDMVSLFNRVHIREGMSLLSLFCHALTS